MNHSSLVTEIMEVLEVSIKLICGHRKFRASNMLERMKKAGGCVKILAVLLAHNMTEGISCLKWNEDVKQV